MADDPVDARHHVPAAPVPGRGDRERRREAPQQGDLAVPAVHARDQRLRAADRVRRPAALPRRERRRRHVRADAADGREAGAARAAGVHRRAVGRDRHGDRRDHRAVDDGLQRPGDAGAAAAAAAAADRAPGPHRAAARHPARRDRAGPAARLPLLPARGRGLRAGLDRPDLVRGGGAVRPGGARRHLLEGRHAPRRAVGAGRRLRRVVLHAAAAGVRAFGLAADRAARARAVRDRAAEAARRCSV